MTKLAENNPQGTANIADDRVLCTVESFLNWKSNLKTVNCGGTIMYDVKGYYKYMHESELWDYWHTRYNCA